MVINVHNVVVIKYKLPGCIFPSENTVTVLNMLLLGEMLTNACIHITDWLFYHARDPIGRITNPL